MPATSIDGLACGRWSDNWSSIQKPLSCSTVVHDPVACQ